jgi:hypothetical protein
MHKMNGQSFTAQKSGLNARKGVKHYSALESNIYWVRVFFMAGWAWPSPGFVPVHGNDFSAVTRS